MLDAELVVAADPDSRQLMVVLHGLGDSMDGYRWLPPMLKLRRMNYLLVNAPEEYFGGFSWYDFMGDADTGVRRSRQLLFELLDKQQRQGFPSEQTVLFGFSQGCLMIIDVGFRYPQRLAGLVGISGHVHEPEQLLQELSPVAKQQVLLATHGTLDPLIPCGLAKNQYKILQKHGLQIEWHEFTKVHTIEGEDEIDLIRRFIQNRFEPGVAPRNSRAQTEPGVTHHES
jgi:phospholipase/carboxylesterase